MMLEEFREVPELSLKEPIGCLPHIANRHVPKDLINTDLLDSTLNKMYYAPLNGSVRLPNYQEKEEMFISDYVQTLDLWAFMGFLDDDFIVDNFENIVKTWFSIEYGPFDKNDIPHDD